MTELQPLGLFDSGIGGLSIWREVVRQLPGESTIYLADNAYCPYGSRPIDQIQSRAQAIGRFLLSRNCKLVVIACNTASAAALELLRARFDVPFVGIEPAIKPAAQATQTGHVGVLATVGTIQGPLFQNTTRRFANGVQVHLQIGQGLVEQVEAGQFNGPVTEQLLHQYLDPMLVAGADQIVLGCTHYPLLMPLIQHVVGGRAQIIDPAPAVARQGRHLLKAQANPLPQTAATAKPHLPSYEFYTTGPSRTFSFEDESPTIFFEHIDL